MNVADFPAEVISGSGCNSTNRHTNARYAGPGPLAVPFIPFRELPPKRERGGQMKRSKDQPIVTLPEAETIVPHDGTEWWLSTEESLGLST